MQLATANYTRPPDIRVQEQKVSEDWQWSEAVCVQRVTDPQLTATAQDPELAESLLPLQSSDTQKVKTRKVECQEKVLIKHLIIFFLFPIKQFLLISCKSCCGKLLPKNRRIQRQKQPCQVRLLVVTSLHNSPFPPAPGIQADKSSWDQPNRAGIFKESMRPRK